MNRGATIAITCAALAVLAITPASGATIDRAAYIRANTKILNGLPRPHRSRIVAQQSIPQYSGFDPPGSVTGYLTQRSYRLLPGSIRRNNVLGFYRERLPETWHLRTAGRNALVYRRGRAMLVIHRGRPGSRFDFLLVVDHKAYR